MKTAEQIILEIQELPPDEKQKVFEFFESAERRNINITHYSDDDLAKINKDIEEAERGENVVGPFQGKEAVYYLRKLRQT